MRTRHALVSLAAVVAATAAWPAEPTRGPEHRERVGEWQVTAFRAGTCSAVREYSGGTHLSVSSSRDGHASLSALNRAWPMRLPQPYRMRLVQGGSSRPLAA